MCSRCTARKNMALNRQPWYLWMVQACLLRIASLLGLLPTFCTIFVNVRAGFPRSKMPCRLIMAFVWKVVSLQMFSLTLDTSTIVFSPSSPIISTEWRMSCDERYGICSTHWNRVSAIDDSAFSFSLSWHCQDKSNFLLSVYGWRINFAHNLDALLFLFSLEHKGKNNNLFMQDTLRLWRSSHYSRIAIVLWWELPVIY